MADKITAAFLAGEGRSGAEIAAALGKASPAMARDLLRSVGIRLPRKSKVQEVITFHWPKITAQAVRDAAHRRDLDPTDMLISIAGAVVAEPTLLDNLLDQEVADATA